MTKISLYIDEDVWAKFRENVFRKHGSLRNLSSEVEALLRSTLVEDSMVSELQKMGITSEGTISSKEVKETRPVLKGPPSEEILGNMRRRRVAQALPRQ